MRVKPVAILPTLCTLANTFCGFLAIAKVADALLFPDRFAEHVIFAAWMIFLAMVFDALDGRIARMTNQASDFGAQLDSLTDLVTFGVAPAFLAKVVFDRALVEAGAPHPQKFALLLSAIYVLCATLRLARFTLETDLGEEAHEKFFGLPSPAAAGVVASSAFLLFEADSPLSDAAAGTRLIAVRTLLVLLPVLGLLMVSRVEYVHLVSRWFRGRRPFLHLVAILVLLALALLWHEILLFAIFSGYAFAGPLLAFAERSAGRRIFAPEEAESEDGPDAAQPALVALGSNLGDREEHLRFALGRLRALPETRLVAVSGFHETEPVGGPPQRPFLNACALLETRLPARRLHEELQRIERARGRERSVHMGPRTLDLDLVLLGNTICEGPDLTLPHPRFRGRRFVLAPACEIAADLEDPVTGKTLRRLLDELSIRSEP